MVTSPRSITTFMSWPPAWRDTIIRPCLGDPAGSVRACVRAPFLFVTGATEAFREEALGG